jgi:hypothetical protein
VTRRPAALLALALLTAACTAAPAPSAPAPSVAPDPLADVRQAPPRDPVEVCADGVAHWAQVDLAEGYDVGDYQQRGLSARQDGARRAIVEEGRAAGGLTADQVRERARAACERSLADDPGPSGF